MLRLAVVLALSLTLSAYVAHCLAKYWRAQVGVSIFDEAATKFEFPAFTICIFPEKILHVEEMNPVVTRVIQAYVNHEEESGEKRWGVIKIASTIRPHLHKNY